MNKEEQVDTVYENKRRQALDGIKVLDFGWAFIGSWTTKYLADYGAQVVKVESTNVPDRLRGRGHNSTNLDDSPWFTHLNTSKYSITLNLKHSRAHEIVEKFVRWADVVTENFSPGIMKRLGFDYTYMRSIKPDIIMASSSIFGQTGPRSSEAGTDLTGTSFSGYLDLSGWPDRAPIMPGPDAPYGDFVTPFFVALTIIAALDYKHKTGKGQYIDTSMVEILAHTHTPSLLDWEANAHLETRKGNRIAYASPHGVFPCRGHDRWCAITVFTDEEWQAFCHVIGDPSWIKEPRFANFKSRKENEDELEKLVAGWTLQYSAEDIMIKMQEAGVPAGVVQDAADIIERDPQLKERGVLVPLKHPTLGVFGHSTPPFKLLKTKAQMRTSPCLGEHTKYVCTEFLCMSNEEFLELFQEGVFR